MALLVKKVLLRFCFSGSRGANIVTETKGQKQKDEWLLDNWPSAGYVCYFDYSFIFTIHVPSYLYQLFWGASTDL